MYWFAVWGSQYDVDVWSDTAGGSSVVLKQNTTRSVVTLLSPSAQQSQQSPAAAAYNNVVTQEVSPAFKLTKSPAGQRRGTSEVWGLCVSVLREVRLGTNQWCYDVREDLAPLTTLERGCNNTATPRTNNNEEQWGLETSQPQHQLASLQQEGLNWPTSVAVFLLRDPGCWSQTKRPHIPGGRRPKSDKANIHDTKHFQEIRFSTRNFVLDITT